MPENMDTVKKLDDFLKDLLFFVFLKKKINKQNLENIFEKLQNKARAVMGSLAKLWEILEDANKPKRKLLKFQYKFSVQWCINWGNVVNPGNDIPHQYSRIISSKTRHADIHKIQRC